MTPLLLTTDLETPLGPMRAVTHALALDRADASLVLLEFVDRPALAREWADLQRLFTAPPPVPAPPDACPALRATLDQLAAYFADERTDFDLPLLTPGTPFQQQVWSALLAIPFGRTTSYGELTDRIARPGAQRAVGAANGANRIAIIIPCHRVIESTGALRGYGGGLHRKKWLLEHEAHHARSAHSPTLFTPAASEH